MTRFPLTVMLLRAYGPRRHDNFQDSEEYLSRWFPRTVSTIAKGHIDFVRFNWQRMADNTYLFVEELDFA